jgi:hypothetical protein
LCTNPEVAKELARASKGGQMVDRGEGDNEGGSPGRGAAERAEAAGQAPEQVGETGSVLTLVCFTCGTEYYFSAGDPPQGISCEKCGNTVFRSFYSAEGEEDEAAADFRESTERDLDADDAEGDTMPGDVLDLNPD